MTVRELKKKLEGVDDNMQVLIPLTHEFDGAFYSPCSKDSGVTAMGTDPYIADVEEDSFLLIPCGFGEEKEHTHELN